MTISVITVCLNAEKYLAAQIESVASQSWRDLEHVIVDGGSSDGTLDIVAAAAAKDNRVRWTSGPDGGISDAMNSGLALATGDIVAFLHADDLYAEDTVLEEVARVFASTPQTEWVTGGVRYIDDEGRVLKSYSPRRWSLGRLMRGNILFHPATFVRRQALYEVGRFDTGLRYTMDYDLWLRLGRRSEPYLLDLPLACFRLHRESTSVRHVDAAFKEEFRVRCRYLAGKPLQKALHFMYFCVKLFPNRMSVRVPRGE